MEIDDDEVAIAGPRETWNHLIELYETLAGQSSDSYEEQAWLNLAEWVRGSLDV